MFFYIFNNIQFFKNCNYLYLHYLKFIFHRNKILNFIIIYKIHSVNKIDKKKYVQKKFSKMSAHKISQEVYSKYLFMKSVQKI